MQTSGWAHPHFERPPIIETAFGIEFVGLPRWNSTFFGLYWETIRDRYPLSSDNISLPSRIEQFDKKPPAQGVSVEVNQTPDIRCWFFNTSNSRLIQVQKDRFIFNWKRGIDGQEYPHYENIKPILQEEWNNFRLFIENWELGQIDIRQCEVSYINHLEMGLGWDDYGDLNQVFPVWAGSASGGFLPTPELVEIKTRYLMPENQGRLYIEAQPVIRIADLKDIIQLTLTVRGCPAAPDHSQVFKWFDLAQEWAAKGFLEFTSGKIQSLWGRQGGHDGEYR